MKSPYPYFGGKAYVAPLIWSRFGDVQNYVDPFFGGGAVLLLRPETHKNRLETVNDLDAHLCNFWRATSADPDAVAHYASDPVSELDLHARGDWLLYRPDVQDFI
jgi:DNA adenine methylase